MLALYVTVGICIAVAIFIGVLRGQEGEDKEKTLYKYKRRNFFMTRAEHEFFDALLQAVGQEYHVFAQVHLPTLIDNKVVGQNWKAAFRHVNGKSVDFVLCDKAYLSPKLAIEVDDKSHERPERQERDREVERILSEAGIPLLRIENHGNFNATELLQKVRELALK